MTEETTMGEYVLRDGPSLMDVRRQAEADRDAYAAVARYADHVVRDDPEEACPRWSRPNDPEAVCDCGLDAALDALTDEQKERIT